MLLLMECDSYPPEVRVSVARKSISKRHLLGRDSMFLVHVHSIVSKVYRGLASSIGAGDEKECLYWVRLHSPLDSDLRSLFLLLSPLSLRRRARRRRGRFCTCSAPRLRPMREVQQLRLSSAQPVQTSQSHAFTPSRPDASSTSSRSVRRPPGTASKPLANPPVWRRAASARIGGSRA